MPGSPAVMPVIDAYPDEARLELAAWVDDIADRFEAAWQSGNPPRIGDYLAETAGQRRLALLVELVKLDSAYRRWLGECRRPADYLDEFPELNESDSFHASATAEGGPSS